ncbi:peptidylprolyl isomerase [Candidatus Sororendozoicomonas aggregata]|uniref:FKBP-type peptidyl-prolyl cis-trans isomerase n=1 Tax=Candidatus Sororendozoicomonas aggregata TaxID=3073239 RepID=UPI002ED6A23E
MSNVIITTGSKVTLHFSLKLEDGAIVDSNFEGNPVSLIIGDGNLPKGFEKQLLGLAADEKKSVTVPPEDAFGMPNPNNIQTIARDAFGVDMALEEGLVVSFSDAGNTELPGVVRCFDEETVEVDFNHPLAGHALQFDVQILDVVTVN